MEGWTTQIYQGLVQNKNPGERRLLRAAERAAARLRHACRSACTPRRPGRRCCSWTGSCATTTTTSSASSRCQRTGCKGGDAAYEKAIGKYPAFNYSKSIFNAKGNWKVNPTGARLALWNRSWSQVIA